MNLAAGTPLPSSVKPAITALQLQAYADASLDHNPIHLDPEFAKAAGFPSVIAHGMLSMAFLADYVVEHFPESGWKLARLQSRFRKVTFPGDKLTCEGRVAECRPDGSVLVTVSTRNEAGEITTEGEAELLPH